jgi:hypothetical protein
MMLNRYLKFEQINRPLHANQFLVRIQRHKIVSRALFNVALSKIVYERHISIKIMRELRDSIELHRVVEKRVCQEKITCKYFKKDFKRVYTVLIGP